MSARTSFTEASAVQEQGRAAGEVSSHPEVLAVLTQGRLDESTTVWDRNGAVVAQATQLAGFRLGSRS